MDVLRFVADIFRHGGKERNDVVIGFFFDLVDAFPIKVRFSQLQYRFLRDYAELGLRFTGINLHVEHTAKLVSSVQMRPISSFV